MRRQRDQRGGAEPIAAVLLIPAVVLLLGVVVACGRIAQAHQSVQTAAGAAARAATVERTAGTAQNAGRAVASSTLSNHGLNCAPSTTIDTSGFARAVGEPASVTATITCQVALSDLAVPGLPGSMTIDHTASAPLDTYRGRR